MSRAGAYVCMGQIRLFLPRFGPFFHRSFAVFSRCPASWRQDGENAPKTAENGRKMAEIVVPKHPKSYVYPTPGGVARHGRRELPALRPRERRLEAGGLGGAAEAVPLADWVVAVLEGAACDGRTSRRSHEHARGRQRGERRREGGRRRTCTSRFFREKKRQPSSQRKINRMRRRRPAMGCGAHSCGRCARAPSARCSPSTAHSPPR